MRLSDTLELLTLGALWGASFLFMRIAAPVIGPVWLIAARVLLAGLALLPLLLRLRAWDVIRPKLGWLFFIGVINSAIPFTLFAYASVSLPAGFTAILNATAPLFGVMLAVTWYRETLKGGRLVGFLLGFVGVVLLVGIRPIGTDTTAFVLAVVAGLAAALLYAIAAPLVRKHLAGVPPLGIAAVTQLSAAGFLLPALPFSTPAESPTQPVIVATVALALFSTALAYIFYFRLVKNIGPTRALTVTYLIPAFAMLWGYLILDEAVTPTMLAGCALVLLGTAVANRGK